MFNFDIKKTSASHIILTEKLSVFKLIYFFRNLFLLLFAFSILLFFASFIYIVSLPFAIKFFIFSFTFLLVFFEVYIFLRLKIEKIELKVSLSDAILNQSKYNLAEFLNIDLTRVVLDAVKFCKKRKIKVSSSALIYSLIKNSKQTRAICFRLGIDIEKLKIDAKNYIEKIEKHEDFLPKNIDNFADDFKKTILEAIKIANDRKKINVGEKEVLIALAKTDEFFKKVLVDFDLKLKDIENITLWLDFIEDIIKKDQKFWSKENLAKMGSIGKDWASGYTITLDQYSVDFVDIVSKWKFKEITSHKKQIENAEMVLARSNLSNVLIVGNSGAGRKSVLEAIAHKCYLSKSLPELNNKRVVKLDMVKLTAGISDFEILEKTLDQIFSEAVISGNVILVIDNLDSFVNQSVQKAGAVDISGILSKYLSMPNFKFLGITTYEGLHRNIEKNSSFAELFRKIEIPEITEEEAIDILQSNTLELEYKKKILILYPAIREIVNLTARYMPSLPFPEKAIDILNEAVVYAELHKQKTVTPLCVAEVVSSKTEIPIGKMEVKEKEILLNLENLIHQRIVNQQEAVKEISIAMRRARAGLSSKTRPMGTFLFLGPTGVGKTETAKALSQIYFKSEKKMVRIDMSEFQAIADIPRLIGAISPVEMQGLLTTPVRENPFSLILLDEIEKSHPNILNLFLQVLDEGHITDGQGRKIIFTNTIIICTSNAGASDIFKAVESGEKLVKDKLLNNLFEKNIFKPEFVNRFDATVIFNPLTKDNLLKIAQLSLESLQKNLKEKEIDFIITEKLKDKIVELSYKPEFGAREMRRVIQDKVENSIAEALLSEKLKKGNKFEIHSETFEVIANPVE